MEAGTQKSFFPKGRETLIALFLITTISGTGYYTYSQMWDLLEKQCANTPGFSTCQFNLSNNLIPTAEIYNGGPAKDGIPSLTAPKMVPAEEASWLQPDDYVIGIEFNEIPRAYPLRIMTWHECVNDSIDNVHFAITYCPLCNSSSVFNRKVGSEILEFGISGRLYQSNVLLYDRQSEWSQESLWSQMMGKAVSGPKSGTSLTALPYQMMKWDHWKKIHPDTKVLSRDTGFFRNYDPVFYATYFNSPDLMFPVAQTSDLFKPKENILGLLYNKVAKAYPVEFIYTINEPIEDYILDKKITLLKNERGSVCVEADEGVEVYNCFWFAWYAFYPDTEIYSGEGFNLESYIASRKMKLQIK